MEKVVDMFTRIGEVLPNFRVYQRIFEGHLTLFNALSEVYLDVITFCLEAKKVFSKAKSKNGNFHNFRMWNPSVLSKSNQQ